MLAARARREGVGADRASPPAPPSRHEPDQEKAKQGAIHGALDHTEGAGRSLRDLPRGIIVIVGIVLMFVWSVLWGAIIALIGLIFFGGFAWGRWY
jgi:hypothetical protein